MTENRSDMSAFFGGFIDSGAEMIDSWCREIATGLTALAMTSMMDTLQENRYVILSEVEQIHQNLCSEAEGSVLKKT